MSLYRYQRIPIGSKRIGIGITMSWTENVITIRANLEASGSMATSTLANEMKNVIERIWTASFDNGYSIICSVNMRFRGTGTEDNARSQIFITNDASATNVNRLPTLYRATMNYNMRCADNIPEWTCAHEFGHMLGLNDRYSESTMSRIRDLCQASDTQMIRGVCGGTRTITVDPGWSGNIMAESRGVLEKKNLVELFALHGCELVTIVEDAASSVLDATTDFFGNLDYAIRSRYFGS